MKYGESAFDVLYLVFAITAGIVMLVRAKKKPGKLMGAAALVLGLGDAFHLVPRVLNYFIEADLTAWLGMGKFVTSVTMTVFYLLVYYIFLGYFKKKENQWFSLAVGALAIVRIILCLLPQNGWLENVSDVKWGVIRNVPFAVLGAVCIALWFIERKKSGILKPTWLLILLSFLFYIPVAVAAGLVPMLGMLMLPKTVCYIVMIALFLTAVLKKRETAK
jgi:hypothetical protein